MVFTFISFSFRTNISVFRIYNGLYGRTEHLDAVFPENTFLVKLHTAVQSRLSAKGEHDAVGTFFFDNHLHEVRGYRQEVNPVGNTFRGLHRGNVRIDEDGVDTFFLQCLERLRTGVVKLSRLTYFQCAGPQQQDFLYIVLFHLS